MAVNFLSMPLGMITVSDFIGQSGRGFYVPEYQRPLTWQHKDIAPLFDSISIGVNRLVDGKDDDVATFIGTMICHNDSNRAIVGEKADALGGEVFVVIDGQQRLTLLMTASALLHDRIRVGMAHNKNQTSEWLARQCGEQLAALARIFESDKQWGDNRFHPRMIRDTDKWSSSIEERSYVSPLSHFCSDYGNFVRKQSGQPEESHCIYEATDLPSEESGLLRDMRESFLGTVQSVSDFLDNICGGLDDRFPPVRQIMGKEKARNALFLPPNAAPHEKVVNLNDSGQKKLVMAAAISRYILSKVYFIALVTSDEDYALDIFESLNATGQPLTAYETFKPEMVRAEGLSSFNRSVSGKHAKEIEASIPVDKSHGKNTADLIVSFALAENGEKISTALRDQRDYMRNQYKCMKTKEEKRRFTEHLMHASQVSGLWIRPKEARGFLPAPSRREFMQEWKEACFCLDFIREANHSISRALMTRFYDAVQISGEGDRDEKIISLCRVVKATAAFFALWRGSRHSTDGIDSRHRTMMKQGVKKLKVGAFSRQGNAPLSECSVISAFRHFLAEGGNSKRAITSRDEWVNHAIGAPIYRGAQKVAKFLLLVASEGAAPSGTPGMLKASLRRGAYPLMVDENSWGSVDYDTVEHVIPQKDRGKLGCDAEELDRLGNLTLLPKKANSLINDIGWGQKRPIYRALSASTEEDLRAAIESPDFPKQHRKSKILKERHLPMTAALAMCATFEYERGGGIIEARGKNLAELAWQRLAVEWLGFDNES